MSMLPIKICPAYAGMILLDVDLFLSVFNLSRVCGDDPAVKINTLIDEIFVPRMRG